MVNNHIDHIDRDGSLRKDRKADRFSLGKRSSVSSYAGRYSRSHSRVRKKGGGARENKENCISNLKMILQCYNVFILVSSFQVNVTCHHLDMVKSLWAFRSQEIFRKHFDTFIFVVMLCPLFSEANDQVLIIP